MRYVVLYNVRSAYNVGAIFRSADGAGVTKMFLVGYTPAPIDRFGRVVAEIQKTSLGASNVVPYEKVDDIFVLIAKLQVDGVEVVAVEQSKDSVSLYEYVPAHDVAYIMGNEIDGVPAAVIDVCDKSLEIPMAGLKESLNVAVTAGIVLFKHPL
jgi:tRNA G18 (ribose-2'-O)-methylase SpoU